MIIKSGQYNQLSEGVKAASVTRLSAALGSKFPEERYGIPEQEWKAGVARRIDRAIKYGIATDGDIFKFLMIDLRFGEYFENMPEHKGAIEILRHRTLAGTRKMEKLFDLLYSL